MTGLNLAAFYELLPSFERAYEADLDQRDKERGKKRLCERGGGRSGTLRNLEDKMLFILVYFRVYPVQAVQGYEPEGVTTYQPMKKPKGKELTAEQKQNNKELSKERIGVEHSIGSIKFFRIAHDTLRNFRTGFDDPAMETACGLHNWHLEFRLTA
jgi:hypothetical protein